MTVAMQQLIWEMQRITDAYHEAIHATADVDAAVALVTDDTEVAHTPSGSGADSAEGFRRHLAEDVLPHLPADLAFRRVSRTADIRKLVDERIVTFTHDRELPWLLPGVPPTHRPAQVLAISVVSFRHRTRASVTDSRIASHRTLWDQVGLLAQLGLDQAGTAVSTRNTLSSR